MTIETQTPATGENNQPPAVAPVTAPPADAPLLSGETPPTPAAQAPTDPAAAPAVPAKPAEPPAAPETYEDFKAPEGMEFNAEAMTEFKALAKEKGLSQEDAQRFADLGAKSVQKTVESFQAKIESTQQEWLNAAQTDKEFGGDKLTENLAVANKALEAFGTPELKQLLSQSKLGNHPEVIRFCYRAGRALSEDRMVAGGTRPAGGNDGQRMYNKSGMNP